jgi:hypothetical protein
MVIQYNARPYDTGAWDREPVQDGDRVRVVAYGNGASIDDVGRTGVVVGLGRTRAKVALVGGGAKSIDPGALLLLERGR